MDKKRIIYIILFSLLCAVLGYAVYRVFFYKPPAPEGEIPPEGITPGTSFPEAEEGAAIRPGVTPPAELPTAEVVPGREIAPRIEAPRVQQVVDNSIAGANIDSTGNLNFYNKSDGRFYRQTADGKFETMSEQIFYNVENVSWSPTQNESIIEYPDGSNIYYNFDTKKQVTLPKHWEDFDFSPAGDQIAAKSMGLSSENRWLVTSDPEANNINLIEPMGNNADKVIVDWSPNRQVVALSLTGESLGADRQEVLFVGLHGENFRSTVVEGRGLVTQWSPQGNKLLYSVYSARNNYKPELWIVNAQGDMIGTDRKSFSLNTWADKCTFQDERYAYCGVPSSLQTGSGFTPALADRTPDILYRIDTQTGLKTEITMDENHTIDTIYLGNGGSTLYFTDKNQSGVFSIDL